ncbi:MAG: GNAT family N-acetyltransferase [Gammaproteobacteria bacterium]|nr:GNAT family N-acetyltransferase [Gammaproteobacteria bacterium]
MVNKLDGWNNFYLEYGGQDIMLVDESDDNSLMLALDRNMIGKFVYLASHSPEMMVNTSVDALTINSYCQTDMFNIICAAKSSAVDSIKRAIDSFKDQKLPFAWWTGFACEPADLEVRLKEANLAKVEHELGMAISLSQVKDPEGKSSELVIEYVDTLLKLNDFIKVIVDLVPEVANAISSFYHKTSQTILNNDSLLKLFVGYLNDKPIATSAIFYFAGVVGVWDVITSVEARGKGVGTKMMIAALKEGINRGYSIGVLTASEQGQYLYKKLGFRSLHEFSVYSQQ